MQDICILKCIEFPSFSLRTCKHQKKPQRSGWSWRGRRQDMTSYTASYLSMKVCNTIQNSFRPLQIPKVISSATAWIHLWKSLKIYCRELGIYIKGRITQHELQCLIVLLSLAFVQCKLQDKLRHTVLSSA